MHLSGRLPDTCYLYILWCNYGLDSAGRMILMILIGSGFWHWRNSAIFTAQNVE